MDYRLHEKGARQYLTFPELDKFPEITALFTTRHGGVSSGCCKSWNFGAHQFDTEDHIRKNYELLAEVLGVSADHMVRTVQTHTTNIRIVTEEDMGKGITRECDYEDVDGLVTDVPGIALITGHADCNAVYFYDPVKRVVGLAHSGWKGTLGGISTAMAAIMTMHYGCLPGDIYTAIGPSLCQNCFEVDEDVALSFAKNDRYAAHAYQKGSKYYIDLKEIIRDDLFAAGFVRTKMTDAGLCTKCRTDMFFSHRGQKGKRGIMAAAIMLRE